MRLVADIHTHTISSGHAYSTIQEMAAGAKQNGMEMIAITDHGPSLPGASGIFHFSNMKVIPEYIYGIRIIKGVEANIINSDGDVDIPDRVLRKMEFVLASLHDVVIEPFSMDENTRALINVLKNPLIDAVAHPGNPKFQVDIEKVVKAAKEYNKLLEINNQSFITRRGSEENCIKFALKCKEYGVRVVCGSDAHISFEVGIFDKVYKILEKAEMPEELVLNTSTDKIENYLLERKKRIGK
ncbi:MAG TPA: phosphatase [Clostridiaceae bacterium]|nr:phosphatase [Clostridiaceae bacterium]